MERVRVYLTNALEPAHDFSGRFASMIPALDHEAQAVNTIKRCQRFTVVIGNPPYAGVSSNNSEHAVHLVDSYKTIDGEPLGEKKLWLQDDYVKFIRLGQLLVEHAGHGVLGYITNHGYLDNPTFRGMRKSLLNSFQRCQLINLHGNTKKKETAPDGTPDANVFDIQQGVAVGLFVRTLVAKSSNTSVMHGDLFGSRERNIFPSLPVQCIHLCAISSGQATHSTFLLPKIKHTEKNLSLCLCFQRQRFSILWGL